MHLDRTHPSGSRTISTTDYHTAGEPFRIVTAGVAVPPGSTVAQRRRWAVTHLDPDRALLCREPRGHADMYGGFLTPPDDDEGDLGVIFFHNDGFSTACGHGTIALATWAVDTGLVRPEPGATEVPVVVDVPSGRVQVLVQLDPAGRPVSASFRNVPAFLAAADIEVPLAQAPLGGIATPRGAVTVDLAYAGAFYAILPATSLGLEVTPADLPALIAAGRAIQAAVDRDHTLRLPDASGVTGLYGVIFTAEVGPDHQRNVTIFADGQVDRSPCGSGTSARLAVLAERGELAVGARFVHDSIVGTRFLGRVLGPSPDAGASANAPAAGDAAATDDTGAAGNAAGDAAAAKTPRRWDTEVTGSAFATGQHTFLLDPADPIGTGFVVR